MAERDRLRTRRPGRRVRTLALALAFAATGLGAPQLGAQVQVQVQDRAALAEAIRAADAGSREIRDFYAARDHAPLWIRDGEIGPEADALLRLIETAELDGLKPREYRPRALADVLNRAADGSPKALAKAEMLLTRTWLSLARDMRRPRDMGMIYADPELQPREASARALLEQAADAPSFAAYVEELGWMSPVYAQLRKAAGAQASNTLLLGPSELRRVRLNLDRARLLPSALGRRYVLVDAAAARLWMYEDGKVAGTMRVVVGKPSDPTPMMAGLIRYANVNPYWNLPPDLVPSRVAAGAVSRGPAFLKTKNYEVLSDWTEDAKPVDPALVDWRAVADGSIQARVRQRPGPGNPMGRIKFMFPNKLGIYLHDTNERELLREGERLFSAGCVRVEDAPRLARWLFRKPVPLGKGPAEQRLDLDEPVPVYITYLTVGVEGSELAFRSDVYGRDELHVAGAGDLELGGR